MPRAKEPQPKPVLREFYFPGAGSSGMTVIAVDQVDAERKLQELLSQLS